MRTIRFLPAAQREYLRAVNCYRDVNDELAIEFMAEVEEAAARILDFPTLGSPYLADTRRIIFRRFPFSIVYGVLDDEIVVNAIAHHSRRPATGKDGADYSAIPSLGVLQPTAPSADSARPPPPSRPVPR